MGALDVAHAADCVACADAVVPRASWADAKRAELAHLAEELRAIQSKRDEPFHHEQPPGPDAPSSSSIVPMVEAMLRAAMERIDAEADAARERTDEVVAAALRRSDDLLRSVEVAKSRLQRVAAGRVQPASEPVLVDLPVDSAPGMLDPWEALDASIADAQLGVLGPVVDLRDAADVHDAFWREVLADAPVRGRLRRWAQGQPS